MMICQKFSDLPMSTMWLSIQKDAKAKDKLFSKSGAYNAKVTLQNNYGMTTIEI